MRCKRVIMPFYISYLVYIGYLYAQVAQSAERTLGKGEVAGSSPVLGLLH